MPEEVRVWCSLAVNSVWLFVQRYRELTTTVHRSDMDSASSTLTLETHRMCVGGIDRRLETAS